MKHTKLAAALALVATLATPVIAQAQIHITEWMYNGAGATGEYVEVTNLGATAVDFTGWSFDDSSRTAGAFSLSALGLVAAGESVVITEATAADFRTVWALAASVKVAGSNTDNLGRGDEINIYDATSALVDRLTYGDLVIPGTVRAQNRSGNPGSLADLQPSAVTTTWVLANAGDVYGSYVASTGDIGSPGSFTLSPVPEPAGWALLLAGGALVALRRRAGVR